MFNIVNLKRYFNLIEYGQKIWVKKCGSGNLINDKNSFNKNNLGNSYLKKN